MTTGELCKRLNLTKKAVRYYVGQRLVTPTRSGNGYADFSEEDAQTLHRVALLRRLDLSVDEIRRVLRGESLRPVIAEKQARIAREKNAVELLSALEQSSDWAALQSRLDEQARRATLLSRIETAFPGGFGRLVGCLFRPFLEDPLESAAQEAAFEKIIAYLDGVDASVFDADALKDADELFASVGSEQAEQLRREEMSAAEDPALWLSTHADAVNAWQAFRKSPEYLSSPACRVEKALRAFTLASGYNDVFLPLMRQISPSYDAFSRRLIAANDVFLASRRPEDP